MATIEAPADSTSKSFSGGLWARFRARRARNKIRQRLQVHFRLTKEGVHFVGVLLFIFFGAVLRDINLLILLAGSMIGLLVLQWRFNSRTLVGLKATRRVASTTAVGRETDVALSIFNPKRWLGSWLVLVEDPLIRQLPTVEKIAQKGSAIVDEVRPQGISFCRYQLNFGKRGRYQIGPSTISTRFPIGLGRGWRTLDNATNIVVHPREGKLTPLAKRLFQQDLHGHTQASAKSGTNEAEFYGLRGWTTGDSKRWIHWRTTARLGELSVRQFERQEHRQVCVLLDLFRSSGAEGDANLERLCETAIEFVATLASSAVMRHHDKLAVAISARRNYSSAGIQSVVLLNSLLDELSTIEPGATGDLNAAFRSISLPLMANPNLVVVSTRENQFSSMLTDGNSTLESRLFARLKVRWLNVSAGDLEPYFVASADLDV